MDERVKKFIPIGLIFVLVIAPMFPVFMVSTIIVDSPNIPNDIPEELSIEIRDTTPKVEVGPLDMHFTQVGASAEGISYVCRRGTEALAYFGVSAVTYLSGGNEFKLEFPQSNAVEPEGELPIGSVTNYLIGNDPSQWRTGLEDFAKLRYDNLYPGVDLVYEIQDGNLKYKFEVAPFANPDVIRLDYIDADIIDVTAESTTVSKGTHHITDNELRVFQDGTGENIGCCFTLTELNHIRFELNSYDESRPLVIDPLVLAYSTYLGGSHDDYIHGIVEEDGYFYVAGLSGSSEYPLMNANDSIQEGNCDGVVTKFSADGQSLIFSTYIGGLFDDNIRDIDVENGYVYITGTTFSSDYPTTQNAFDTSFSGIDVFVTKFNLDGQSLNYSTFYGGTGGLEGLGIAVENGCAYFCGVAYGGSTLPLVEFYDGICEMEEGFVAKMSSNGQSLVYSTYLGGRANDWARGIAVEGGNAYVTGETESNDFPFGGGRGYDTTYNGQIDCFVIKLDTSGIYADYCTYLGGDSEDIGYAIDVENGYAHVTGETYSDDYPTANAYDSSGSSKDSFVTKLSTDGCSLIYSTYLGGSSYDTGYAITIENGFAYVTGATKSSDFPLSAASDPTYNGNEDVFVTKFSKNGTTIEMSTFFGGSGFDRGEGIVVQNGTIFAAGFTDSSNLTTQFPYASTSSGSYDGFVFILDTDQDMDGLSDNFEMCCGTNLYRIDTDFDNFLDSYEFLYGSDPLDPMDYPSMPQAWYDSIYEDLDGNATLIQNLIKWVDGNSTLLETVMQQLDDNTTLLTQVIAWLDGNHSAIETLFTQLDGNATLLLKTVNSLNGNTSLIQNLLTWSAGNETLLLNVITQVDAIEPTDLTQVIAWLDGNHTAIETLFTYVEGNATLLLSTIADVNYNEAQLDILAALISGNAAFLNSLNATHFEDYEDIQDAIDEIRAVVEELGISVGDADYDGLDDLDELAYGTDLLCIDTDVDNLNDAFEIKLGTNPLDDDSDSDSYLDGVEVVAGTDPLDPLSYPGSTQFMDPMVIVLALGGVGVVVIIVIVIGFKKIPGRS